MRSRFGYGLALAILLAGIGIARGEPQGSAADADDESGWQAVDAQTCGDCHDEQLASMRRGPHAVLDENAALAAHLGASSSCNACHGDPTAHLDAGGEAGTIFAFGEEESALVKSQQCLSCHADSHPAFLNSHHAVAGLDCGSCHVSHPPEGAGRRLLAVADPLLDPGIDAASATCASCHGEVFASFEWNERHRLREGIVGCTDCHNPHEPPTRVRLGGFKQEACVQCHADKGGPFVFEHGSVMVEGCVACHTPHGSPNRHLLTFQSTAELCYSCHAVVPGFHTRFNADTICTNCHSSIHGSNFHPAFLE